jgi:hypothetical protein
VLQAVESEQALEGGEVPERYRVVVRCHHHARQCGVAANHCCDCFFCIWLCGGYVSYNITSGCIAACACARAAAACGVDDDYGVVGVRNEKSRFLRVDEGHGCDSGAGGGAQQLVAVGVDVEEVDLASRVCDRKLGGLFGGERGW